MTKIDPEKQARLKLQHFTREVSMMMNKIANMLLEIDARHMGYLTEYDDLVCIDTLHIFSHILSSRTIHKLRKNKIDDEMAKEIVVKLGEDIRKIFIRGTGIDPKKFYG